MDILVVIDMQNDFIDGALGSPQAQAIVPAVVEKVASWEGEILFTRDTHDDQYLESQEGKNLPVVHCVKDSEGWQVCPQLEPFIKNTPFDKPTFGSTQLPSRLKELMGTTKESQVTITLVGLCTDICVISNAMILKPAFPEAEIRVDSVCCAGVTAESHNNALEAMKMCQVTVV